MKIFVIFILIFFCILTFFALTNPTEDVFKTWYKENYEDPLTKQMNVEVQKGLDTGNDTLQWFVNGAYEVLAKDKVQDIIQDQLNDIYADINIKRRTFYTVYDIYLPDNKSITVYGYLNSIHENVGLLAYFLNP